MYCWDSGVAVHLPFYVSLLLGATQNSITFLLGYWVPGSPPGPAMAACDQAVHYGCPGHDKQDDYAQCGLLLDLELPERNIALPVCVVSQKTV